MSAPKRPVLRYLGGKWKLAPWIIAHMPPHRVYVEPFCGAASVLMRKPRSVAEIINDRSGEIVEVFTVLRDPVSAARLEAAIDLTPFARDEFALAYEYSPDPIERVRRLIFRSFAGLHPGSATASAPKGMHTRTSTWVRGGRKERGGTKASDWARYGEHIASFVERLRGVVIDNQDAGTVIAQHDSPETLLYVDPPYVHGARNIDATSGRYLHEMSDLAHAVLLAELVAAKSMILLSAYANPLYEEFLPRQGWLQESADSITHNGTRRTEVLWLNPAAQDALASARSLDRAEALA